MKANETKLIDGMKFHVSTLPPSRQMKLLNRILRAARGGIREALALGLESLKQITEADAKDAGPMLAGLLEGFTEEEQDKIFDELKAACRVEKDGQVQEVSEVFDIIFLGNVWGAYKLMAHALKVQFGNFSNARDLLGIETPAPTPQPSGR